MLIMLNDDKKARLLPLKYYMNYLSLHLVSHNMVIDYPGQALYTKRIKKVDDKK